MAYRTHIDRWRRRHRTAWMLGLRLVMLAALMGLSARGVLAQNTFAKRVSLVSVLNQKLTDLRLFVGDSLILRTSDTDTLNLYDPVHSCYVVPSDTTIILKKIGSGFMMRVLIRPSDTMYVPPGSHQMVCDLNEVWLARSWRWHFYDSIGTHRLGDPTTCWSGGDLSQAYFMAGIADISSDPFNGIHDSLRFLKRPLIGGLPFVEIGDWGVHNTWYWVVNTSGEEERVADRCFFPRVISNNTLGYIGKRIDGGADRDTASVKLSYTSVEFNPLVPVSVAHPYPDNSSKEMVTKVELIVHTQQYSPDDCSEVTGGNDYPDPNPDSAAVVLKFWIKNTVTEVETPYICSRSFANADRDISNEDLWNFYSPDNEWILRQWCEFDIDSLGYLVFKIKDAAACLNPGSHRIMRLRNPYVPPEYCEVTFADINGSFKLDSMTGAVYYQPACSLCTREAIPCLAFCTQLSGFETIDGVIAASAQRFGDFWPYDTSDFLRPKVLGTWVHQNESNNRFEVGSGGKWRSEEHFIYRTNIKHGGKIGSSSQRVYSDAGVFVNDVGLTSNGFRLFNWRDEGANAGTKWLRVDTVTLVSPNGEPMEERDVLGVYSAARFAHHGMLPRLIAKNARYTSVGFESFEDGRGTTQDTAHSGDWSYRLPATGYTQDTIMKLVVTDQMLAKGIEFKVWVKRTYNDYSDLELPININLLSGQNFKKVAQTGEWTLYEKFCDITASHAVGDTLAIKFQNTLSQPTEDPDLVWIDDPRAQPYDAEMTCYVYHPASLRLLAQFDDQHFGLYYQYNGEGKLVRRLVETERGLKMVSEAQYNTPQLSYRDGTVPSQTQYGGDGGGPASTMRIDGSGPAATEPNGLGTQFDLLDIQLGTDGIETKILGKDPSKLREIDISRFDPGAYLDTTRLTPPQIEQFKDLGLFDERKLKLVAEVREIDRRLESIAEQKEKEMTDEGRKELDAAVADLQARRSEILERELGVSEEELSEIYRTMESIESESPEEDNAE